MAVGSKLAEIIKQKGLTQKEVAERAGISPQTLNKIITRDSARADVQLFLKVCAALGVPVSLFADDAIEEYYQDHPNAEPMIISDNLTKNEKRIINLFKQLDDIQQENIIAKAELLVEQNNENKEEENIG